MISSFSCICIPHYYTNPTTSDSTLSPCCSSSTFPPLQLTYSHNTLPTRAAPSDFHQQILFASRVKAGLRLCESHWHKLDPSCSLTVGSEQSSRILPPNCQNLRELTCLWDSLCQKWINVQQLQSGGRTEWSSKPHLRKLLKKKEKLDISIF